MRLSIIFLMKKICVSVRIMPVVSPVFRSPLPCGRGQAMVQNKKKREKNIQTLVMFQKSGLVIRNRLSTKEPR